MSSVRPSTRARMWRRCSSTRLVVSSVMASATLFNFRNRRARDVARSVSNAQIEEPESLLQIINLAVDPTEVFEDEILRLFGHRDQSPSSNQVSNTPSLCQEHKENSGARTMPPCTPAASPRAICAARPAQERARS